MAPYDFHLIVDTLWRVSFPFLTILSVHRTVFVRKFNDWIIETYQNKGGSFGPKSVGNYASNRPHGLFESFGRNGETISKDEYRNEKRTSHKSFDPGQKWQVPDTLATWAK